MFFQYPTLKIKQIDTIKDIFVHKKQSNTIVLVMIAQNTFW